MKVKGKKRMFIVIAALFALLMAVLLVMGFAGQSAAPQADMTAAAAETVLSEEDASACAAEAVPLAETTTPEQSSDETDSTGSKAIAAGIAIGLAAAAGAIGMGIAIAKTSEAIARQPEAEGKIRSTLMLGLVFIETAIIYALIVAILVIFVL